MNRSELIMRRVNVREFINADPISLVISRAAVPIQNTGTGGYTQGLPSDLDPQKARIVLNKRRYNPGIVNAEAGDIPHTDYLLIGKYSLDIQEEDQFFWKGEKYKIVGIHKQRIESILAAIELLGPVNRSG
jgi:hypothetical protein